MLPISNIPFQYCQNNFLKNQRSYYITALLKSCQGFALQTQGEHCSHPFGSHSRIFQTGLSRLISTVLPTVQTLTKLALILFL